MGVSGDDILEAKTRLLDEGVRGSVNFKGVPASRSKSGCWKSVAFIIGIEVAERFGYYGINSNLITYLTGPLGRSVASAAANVNAWTGTALLMSLVGAFVADSFLGRFRTILSASLLFILGLGFMSVSSATHSLNSNCKIDADNSGCSPPQLKVVAFFFSLYLEAFAEGGLRPSMEAFGADQFDEEDKNESRAKSSFFNWWYFIMHGSCFAALLILNYIQENLSWELGFGIPCIMMCVTLIIFLLGSTRYRFRVNSDGRNPFVRIGRVFVRAAKNWHAAPVRSYIQEEACPQGFWRKQFLQRRRYQTETRTRAPHVTWMRQRRFLPWLQNGAHVGDTPFSSHNSQLYSPNKLPQ